MDKYLTVRQLRGLLDRLPEEARLRPNALGNLVISNDQDHYQGYLEWPTQQALHRGDDVLHYQPE